MALNSTTLRCGALLLAWSSSALQAQELPAPAAPAAPATEAASPEATTLKPVEVRAS